MVKVQYFFLKHFYICRYQKFENIKKCKYEIIVFKLEMTKTGLMAKSIT